MVLALKCPRIYSLLALLMSPLAAAATFESMQVEKSNCSLRLVDSKAKRFRNSKLKYPTNTRLQARPLAGSSLLGKKIPSTSNLFLLQDPRNPNTYYVGNGSCLFPKTLARKVAAPSKMSTPNTRVRTISAPSYDPTLSPSKAFRPRWVTRFNLYAQTYRSEIKITFPQGIAATLDTQTLGVMPELAFVKKSQNSEYSFAIGFFYGRAQVGKSLAEAVDPALTNFDYQAKNVALYGFDFSPAYYFRPESRNVAFGFKLPIKYSKAAWPVPGPTYSVGPASEFAISYLVEARVERENLAIVQNFGFYKGIGRILWSIGGSYEF